MRVSRGFAFFSRRFLLCILALPGRLLCSPLDPHPLQLHCSFLPCKKAGSAQQPFNSLHSPPQQKNIVAGPSQKNRLRATQAHGLPFAKPTTASKCFVPHRPVRNFFSRNTQSSRTLAHSRTNRDRLGSRLCRHKQCLAAEMVEKQRQFLSPALVKLDRFCRRILSESEAEAKDENEMLRGDAWNHTIYPQAFQALEKEYFGQTASSEATAASAAGKHSVTNETQEEEKGSLSMFTHHCELLSKLLGIPSAPSRRHRVSQNAGNGENAKRDELLLSRSALELPSKEMIELVAKQIGRFPYGLLSIARQRKKSSRDELLFTAESEAAERAIQNPSQTIPQILTVSPFWIAPRKPATASALADAKQRVVQSVASVVAMASERKEQGGEAGEQITPFPTTFWLCDGRLSSKLSEAELTGWIKQTENTLLANDSEIQEKVIYDSLRFIALRWLLVPKAFLVHFYATNRRCAKCGEKKPEGRLLPELESEKHSHCAPKGKHGSDEGGEMQKTREADRGAEQCTECLECVCQLCKLMQCQRSRGVGGLMNFRRIRCLHMQYAYHLACPTTVGNMIDDAFNVSSCLE